MSGGSRPYLCPYDEAQIIEELSLMVDKGKSENLYQVRCHFQLYAERRLKKALNVFLYTFRTDLYKLYQYSICLTPSDKYVSNIIHKYKYKDKDFALQHTDEIDILRIVNACPKVLTPWYRMFFSIRDNYVLIFGADEMGLELSH